jgi:hypothetical protein
MFTPQSMMADCIRLLSAYVSEDEDAIAPRQALEILPGVVRVATGIACVCSTESSGVYF